MFRHIQEYKLGTLSVRWTYCQENTTWVERVFNGMFLCIDHWSNELWYICCLYGIRELCDTYSWFKVLRFEQNSFFWKNRRTNRFPFTRKLITQIQLGVYIIYECYYYVIYVAIKFGWILQIMSSDWMEMNTKTGTEFWICTCSTFYWCRLSLKRQIYCIWANSLCRQCSR